MFKVTSTWVKFYHIHRASAIVENLGNFQPYPLTVEAIRESPLQLAIASVHEIDKIYDRPLHLPSILPH